MRPGTSWPSQAWARCRALTLRQVARRVALLLTLALSVLALLPGQAPAATNGSCPTAEKALGPVNPCTVIHNAHRLLNAGVHAVTHPISTLAGVAASFAAPVARAAVDVGLGAVVSWATRGASFALRETATLIDATTAPHLDAPWFSAVYWRVAAIATVLTLPFLFAAAVQALLRSDLSLLAQAAFGYLPLAMLLVGVIAQLAALLLSATDVMSGLVAQTAGQGAGAYLGRAAAAVGTASLLDGSPFLAFLLAVFTVAGAVALWTELVMREAAVYIIVAMLPLAFAAMVWPARRVWALRAVEILVALILAKLAIVIVLTLGGAALESRTVAGFMMGPVLLALALFAPWAMVRLLPMAELASGAAGRLKGELAAVQRPAARALGIATAADRWAAATTAAMRREAGGESWDTPAPQLDAGAAVPSEEPPSDGSGDGTGTTLPPEGPWPGGGPADDAGFDDGDGYEDAPDLPASEASDGPIGGDDNPGWLGVPQERSGFDDRPDAGQLTDGLLLDGPPPSGEHFSWELPLGPGMAPERPWPGSQWSPAEPSGNSPAPGDDEEHRPPADGSPEGDR